MRDLKNQHRVIDWGVIQREQRPVDDDVVPDVFDIGSSPTRLDRSLDGEPGGIGNPCDRSCRPRDIRHQRVSIRVSEGIGDFILIVEDQPVPGPTGNSVQLRSGTQ